MGVILQTELLVQPGPFLPLVLVLQALLFWVIFAVLPEEQKGFFFAIGALREVGANGAMFFLYSNVLFLTGTTEDTLGTEGTLGTSR